MIESYRYFNVILWHIFFKGMFMGMSDVIPGISGGTVAFATGIYSRLLSNISKIDLNFIKAFLKKDFSYISNALEWKFLISLFLGMAVSILSFSRLITYILSKSYFSYFLYSLILGLVIGSILFLKREIDKWRSLTFLYFVLGAVLAYFACKVSIVSNGARASTYYFFDPILILAGSLAITAMLLPGISGSFVLLLFGQYNKVIVAISSLTKHFDVSSYSILFNLGIGVFFGMIFFSKIITFLLNKYKNSTISFLLGLMVGSIYLIYPSQKNSFSGNFNILYFFISMFLIVVGIMSVLFFKKNDNNKQKSKDIACI